MKVYSAVFVEGAYCLPVLLLAPSERDLVRKLREHPALSFLNNKESGIILEDCCNLFEVEELFSEQPESSASLQIGVQEL